MRNDLMRYSDKFCSLLSLNTICSTPFRSNNRARISSKNSPLVKLKNANGERWKKKSLCKKKKVGSTATANKAAVRGRKKQVSTLVTSIDMAVINYLQLSSNHPQQKNLKFFKKKMYHQSKQINFNAIKRSKNNEKHVL